MKSKGPQLSLLGVVPPAVALPPREDWISPCGLYRYWLKIPLAETELNLTCVVVMFNSSTASKDADDPTTESIQRIVRGWQPQGAEFGAVEIVNLHGYRSPDPKALVTLADPVGPDNARAVEEAAQRASHVIVGWGGLVNAHPDYQRRAVEMIARLRRHHPALWCFKKNKDGTPTHPLYLSGKTVPTLFGNLRGPDEPKPQRPRLH